MYPTERRGNMFGKYMKVKLIPKEGSCIAVKIRAHRCDVIDLGLIIHSLQKTIDHMVPEDRLDEYKEALSKSIASAHNTREEIK
jgi:hypothetical protein